MSATTTQTVSHPSPASASIRLHGAPAKQDNVTSSLPERSDLFQRVWRGNREGTIKMPGVPTFEDKYEERTWVKEHMAGAFRWWGKLGFGEGTAGHITVRDPVLPDHYWMNPFGMHFSLIKVSMPSVDCTDAGRCLTWCSSVPMDMSRSTEPNYQSTKLVMSSITLSTNSARTSLPQPTVTESTARRGLLLDVLSISYLRTRVSSTTTWGCTKITAESF